MIVFRDRTGRIWTGRLDTAAAIRMRDIAGEDVMELALSKQDATTFSLHPARLANALFAILLPTCERLGIDDVRFGRLLPGRRLFRPAVPTVLSEQLLSAILGFFECPEMLPGKPKDKSREPLTASKLWCYLWASASVAGVSPFSFTFGELAAMADAKRKHEWAQTSNLMAYIARAAGAKITAADIDPTGALRGASTQKLELTPQTFGLFASVLMRGNN